MSVIESTEALGILVVAIKARVHGARIMLQSNLAPLVKQVGPKRRWIQWFQIANTLGAHLRLCR